MTTVLFSVLFIGFQALLILFSMAAGDELTSWGKNPTTENSRTTNGMLTVVLLCEVASILCVVGMVWM